MKTWREGSRTWNLCGVHWASKRGVFVRVDITGTVNSFYLEFSSFFRCGFLFFKCFFLVLKVFISLFFVFCCFFTYFCLVFHWPVSFLTLTLVSVSRVVVNTGWNVIYHHISAKQNTLERSFKKKCICGKHLYIHHTCNYLGHEHSCPNLLIHWKVLIVPMF